MIRSSVRRILYVDDTEEQRYAMRRILEGAGYTVVEAGTGTEALAKLDPSFLAVVLDVKLPDISGYEVCRRIKATPETSALPVLQVSASFADPALRAHGLQGGADAYIAQPVHAAELLALVGALIQSHDSDRTLRFQAEVSRKLNLTLDRDETLRTIEEVFIPRFADHCRVLLRPGGLALGQAHTPAQDQAAQHYFTLETAGEPLDPALLDAALEVSRSGAPRLIHAGDPIPASAPTPVPCISRTDVILVPLVVGRKHLGTIVFLLDGKERQYLPSNLALAHDLADRAALALQNATLYTAQLAAQAALVQSEKLAAAGRLSAAIAHEINNPLESITNLMYLVDTSDEITPTIKGYVQEALSELSRLTHIARQSLGFYRELTGPQLFDLNESIEDTLSIYMKRFQSKHLRIQRAYAVEKLEIRAVKGEVRQVISNLLVNAYDALPDEGCLRVETELLPDGQQGDARKVVFRVVDDGPGIPEQVLAHIFEPFFTTKQGTGTGLGLWVSNTIVTKHCGSIQVTSHTDGPSHGTTFEVTLPVTSVEIET